MTHEPGRRCDTCLRSRALLVGGVGTHRLQDVRRRSIEFFLALQLDSECRFDDGRPDPRVACVGSIRPFDAIVPMAAIGGYYQSGYADDLVQSCLMRTLAPLNSYG
jgi:hypothetical protein